MRFFKSKIIAVSLVVGFASLAQADIEASSLALPSESSTYSAVRILVDSNADRVELSSKDPYRFEMLESGGLLHYGKGTSIIMADRNERIIRIGDRWTKLPGFRVTGSVTPISVAKNEYRGDVYFVQNAEGGLSVINEVDIEEYLRGVLPSEVWASWPLEMLKAQAVVSRTYTVFKAISHAEKDFDMTNGVMHQVYGGQDKETKATDAAVRLTHGEILTYRGQVFPAYFHSTCGGSTTHPEYQWDVAPHPALRTQVCSYCETSKHYKWKRLLSLKEIEHSLRKAGHKIGYIRDISPQVLDASGRPRQIMIVHSEGQLFLRANDFRLAVGPQKVKSLRDMRVTIIRDQVLFTGKGWGHGVGMCQYGAKEMVKEARTYKDILEFYYPGAEITKLKI